MMFAIGFQVSFMALQDQVIEKWEETHGEIDSTDDILVLINTRITKKYFFFL